MVVKQQKGALKPEGAGTAPAKEAIVASLKKTLKLQLQTDLEKRLEESANSPDGESAAAKLHKSAAALRSINDKLNALADTGADGDRKTAMNRKIITAWWGWLRKSRAGK